MNTTDVIIAFIFGVVLGFLIGVGTTISSLDSCWKQQAIVHNAGYYNPTNGVFQWKD